MMRTTFRLRQILNMTTGKLLTSMDDIYLVGNAVTGDNLCTHVLPRAFHFCNPEIRRQLPFLSTQKHLAEERALADDISECVGDPLLVRRAINNWCDLMEKEYGAEHRLTARPDLWLTLDPITEAEAIVGKGNVIKMEI